MVNQNQQYGRQRRGNAPTKCICPDCGYETDKIRGVPCREAKCPECGTTMMGK